MFISLENSSEKSPVQNFRITNNFKIYIKKCFFYFKEENEKKNTDLGASW